MRNILIVGGSIIAVLAILDMLDIPLEIPTKNNFANLAIGLALIASPFVLKVG